MNSPASILTRLEADSVWSGSTGETYAGGPNAAPSLATSNEQVPVVPRSQYDELIGSRGVVGSRKKLAAAALITALAGVTGTTPRALANPTGSIPPPKVVEAPSQQQGARLPEDDSVAKELSRIRVATGFPVHEIARLCGLQRRQVYNLLDGQETDPHRAIAIREIASHIDRWSHRIGDQARLRSALLAPIGSDARSFIDLAGGSTPDAVARAAATLDAYLERLGAAQPPLRTMMPAYRNRSGAAQLLQDMYGDNEPASDG